MDEVHGKEINLVRTTVKVPGQRPRGSQQSQTNTNGSLAPQSKYKGQGQSKVKMSLKKVRVTTTGEIELYVKYAKR